MDENDFIAARIQSAREATGLNQRDFAAKIGKPKSTFANWEAGQKKITCVDLLKVARFTKKPISYFFPNEGNLTESAEPELEKALIKIIKDKSQKIRELESSLSTVSDKKRSYGRVQDIIDALGKADEKFIDEFRRELKTKGLLI